MDIDVKRHVDRLHLKSVSSFSLYKQSGGLRNQLHACSVPGGSRLPCSGLDLAKLVSSYITTQPKTRLLLVEDRPFKKDRVEERPV
jgi:hypothetical protein